MYILLQKAKLWKRTQVEVKVPEELYGYRIHKPASAAIRRECDPARPEAERRRVETGDYHEIGRRPMHIIVKDNGRGIRKMSYRGFMTAKMKQML